MTLETIVIPLRLKQKKSFLLDRHALCFLGTDFCVWLETNQWTRCGHWVTSATFLWHEDKCVTTHHREVSWCESWPESLWAEAAAESTAFVNGRTEKSWSRVRQQVDILAPRSPSPLSSPTTRVWMNFSIMRQNWSRISGHSVSHNRARMSSPFTCVTLPNDLHHVSMSTDTKEWEKKCVQPQRQGSAGDRSALPYT